MNLRAWTRFQAVSEVGGLGASSVASLDQRRKTGEAM